MGWGGGHANHVNFAQAFILLLKRVVNNTLLHYKTVSF